MARSKVELEKLFRLARLEMDVDLSKKLALQLDSIIQHFDTLGSVDTAGIEPLVTPSSIELELRKDVLEAWDQDEEVKKQAPSFENSFYVVPPVVDKEGGL